MKDPCKSFAFADIPLDKLNNPAVRNFHVTCTQKKPLYQGLPKSKHRRVT